MAIKPYFSNEDFIGKRPLGRQSKSLGRLNPTRVVFTPDDSRKDRFGLRSLDKMCQKEMCKDLLHTTQLS